MQCFSGCLTEQITPGIFSIRTLCTYEFWVDSSDFCLKKECRANSRFIISFSHRPLVEAVCQSYRKELTPTKPHFFAVLIRGARNFYDFFLPVPLCYLLRCAGAIHQRSHLLSISLMYFLAFSSQINAFEASQELPPYSP